ncbi:MAG TPA: hypothetical protein VHE35_21080 [Kofleriaceae bacterium]|nr:hypothetical protein [Kofleriaceae bacterium]
MRLSQAWTQFRILHAALTASLVVYAVVAVAATQGKGQVSDLDPKLLLSVLGAVGAVELLVVVPLLRRKLMPARDPFSDPVDLEVDVGGDDPVNVAIGRLRSVSILTWALCESVAILGLVAAFVYREPRYYAGFGAAGLLGMLWYAPRRGLLEEVVRAARRPR